MLEVLKTFDIKKNELEKFASFVGRTGFIKIEKDEFQEIYTYFQQFTLYKDIIPLLSDSNSNYWCMYISGPLRGMICYLSHDEVNLEPKFHTISNLIEAIETHPDAYDFSILDALEQNVFDFPKKDLIDFPEREYIVKALLDEFSHEMDEERRQQLAFSIMSLTHHTEIESTIYPFINNEDMYIQERAIWFLGFHSYKPAQEKLQQLLTTAMPNGKLAAKIALRKLKLQA